MIQFDDSKQERKYTQLREQEEEDAMQLVSARYNIPYIDLSTVPVNADALILVPEADAREAQLAAFTREQKSLGIAIHSPENANAQEIIESLKTRGFSVTLFIASTKSLTFAWDRYKDMTYTSESKRGMLDVSSEDIAEFVKTTHGIEDVKKRIAETLTLKKSTRTSSIVEILLASALATGSSDIHIEPEENAVRMRLRLDGILTDTATLDKETHHLLLSRLKLLSGLKLNVAKEAQDGRFSIRMGTTEIEIRTSVLPGNYGESIVMRILNPDTISASIDVLGMRPELRAAIEDEIRKPNGMILTTGPTGSGKTTTLYAFLKHVHTSEVKIITIEDPVEYHLQGIVQTQVDAEKEYTFSSGLRAALRQDPDIIMVGEIRDGETAEIAIHAALTGHLVFSTLHTNSAAGAFTRLMDLGISSNILGSSINMALAQRLVRKLCPNCKQEIALTETERAMVEKHLSTVTKPELLSGIQRDKVWKAGPGCADCGGDGYKGRMGIFEAIQMNEAIEQVVRSSPSEREIQTAAAPQGFLTMAQDAIVKILEGGTTFDEVSRVVDIS